MPFTPLRAKFLDSKLQNPSLGTAGLPCLPEHWVEGRNCGHPQTLRGHPAWRESFFTAGNMYRRNSRDYLTYCLEVAGLTGFGYRWEESSSWKVGGPSPGSSLPIPLVGQVGRGQWRCSWFVNTYTHSRWSTEIEYCPLSHAEWPLENIGPPLAGPGELGPPR